jgi:uncharacterized protein involved in exopolysaccharide biosynthesis
VALLVLTGLFLAGAVVNWLTTGVGSQGWGQAPGAKAAPGAKVVPAPRSRKLVIRINTNDGLLAEWVARALSRVFTPRRLDAQLKRPA